MTILVEGDNVAASRVWDQEGTPLRGGRVAEAALQAVNRFMFQQRIKGGQWEEVEDD
jgi:hypothetical protein